MTDARLHRLLEEYTHLLTRSGADGLAVFTEMLADNAAHIEHDTPVEHTPDRVPDAKQTALFTKAAALAILQYNAENKRRNPDFTPSIDKPFGYYSRTHLDTHADPQLRIVFDRLETYGNHGELMSAEEPSENVIDDIQALGYSRHATLILTLGYSIGGVLALIYDQP